MFNTAVGVGVGGMPAVVVGVKPGVDVGVTEFVGVTVGFNVPVFVTVGVIVLVSDTVGVGVGTKKAGELNSAPHNATLQPAGVSAQKNIDLYDPVNDPPVVNVNVNFCHDVVRFPSTFR